MIGIMGAGRLGKALFNVLTDKSSAEVALWSKSGWRSLSASGDSSALWLSNWSDLFSGTEGVFIAISGAALMGLMSSATEAQDYQGWVFSASPTVPYAVLREIFPSARIVRIAPFLVDALRSIPILALCPLDHVPSLDEGIAKLRNLGEVDLVDREIFFDFLTLMGSPFPIVVTQLVEAAHGLRPDLVPSQQDKDLVRKIYYRAILALLSEYRDGAGSDSSDSVITPGGITSQGLLSLPILIADLRQALDRMATHAAQGASVVSNIHAKR
jgi:pyrroline-5-carboxylate reductase